MVPLLVSVDGGFVEVADGGEFFGDDFYNNDPALAPILDPANVYVSHIGSEGDIDYWRIPPQPAGTLIQAFVTNEAADRDLFAHRPVTQDISQAPNGQPPLNTQPILDNGQPLGSNEEQSAPQGQPEQLIQSASVTDPLASYSTGFGGADEEISIASVPGENVGDGYLLVVASANGEADNEGYVIRARISDPAPSPVCPPIAYPELVPFSYDDSLITRAPLDPATNVVFLLNYDKLYKSYPAVEVDAIDTSLNALIAYLDANFDSGENLGLKAEKIHVDRDLLVRDAYTALDTNPCNVEAANKVVSEITGLMAQVGAFDDAVRPRDDRRWGRHHPDDAGSLT